MLFSLLIFLILLILSFLLLIIYNNLTMASASGNTGSSMPSNTSSNTGSTSNIGTATNIPGTQYPAGTIGVSSTPSTSSSTNAIPISTGKSPLFEQLSVTGNCYYDSNQPFPRKLHIQNSSSFIEPIIVESYRLYQGGATGIAKRSQVSYKYYLCIDSDIKKNPDAYQIGLVSVDAPFNFDFFYNINNGVDNVYITELHFKLDVRIQKRNTNTNISIDATFTFEKPEFVPLPPAKLDNLTPVHPNYYITTDLQQPALLYNSRGFPIRLFARYDEGGADIFYLVYWDVEKTMLSVLKDESLYTAYDEEYIINKKLSMQIGDNPGSRTDLTYDLLKNVSADLNNGKPFALVDSTIKLCMVTFVDPNDIPPP